MKEIDYLPILGYAAFYVVTIFATAFLGYLSPYAWVFFPAIAALLGAFSYYSVAVRRQKFGVGTLLAFILAGFLLAVGECDLSEALLMLLAGVLADVVRQFIGNTSLKGQSIAYPILSIGVIAWIPYCHDPYGMVYASLRYCQRCEAQTGALLRHPRLPRRRSHAIF